MGSVPECCRVVIQITTLGNYTSIGCPLNCYSIALRLQPKIEIWSNLAYKRVMISARITLHT